MLGLVLPGANYSTEILFERVIQTVRAVSTLSLWKLDYPPHIPQSAPVTAQNVKLAKQYSIE